MSFSLSGSVITQSGTDTSLAGLAGIAGVTVTNFTSGAFITYSCAYRIVINGTLTIDPERELLITSYAPAATTEGGVVRVAGTLNIGVDSGPEATKRKTQGFGIYITSAAQQAGGVPDSGRVTVAAGGTLNLYSGVKLGSSGEIYAWDATSNLNVSDAFVFTHLVSTSSNIRLRSSTCSVNGLETNLSCMFLQQPATARRISVKGAARALVFYGKAAGVGVADQFVVSDYAQDASTPQDVEFIDTAYADILNASAGSGLRVRNWRGLGVPSRTAGYIRAAQDVQFYVSDQSNAPIIGVKLFCRDTDGGQRKNLNSRDDTADKTYTLTSGVAGNTGSATVVVAIWNKGATGDIDIPVDLRFGATDTATFGIKGYTTLPASRSYQLRRLGGLSETIQLLADPGVTLSESAAGALTAIATWDDLYDRLKWWGVQDANLEIPSASSNIATSSGGVVNLGAYNLTVDATAASTLSVAGSTITVKASTLAAGAKHASLTTTGTVTAANGATITGLYTDSAGTHTTITAASIVAGSRVQLYSVTDSTELLNTVLSSTGLAYANTWTADKTIRLRADHPDYLPLEATGILTASGLQFLVAQEVDTVYIGNGIDGSTVTEFEADGLAIHVDVDDPDGYTLVQRLYAWLQHYQTTEAGIASEFFGAMAASDSANYQIDQDKADIHLDNVTTSPLMIVGGYLTRKDGSTVIAATSGSIQMDPGRAYVAPGTAPADVWGYATRTLTADPGTSAHATTQAAVAAVPAAVRTELATELARLDVAVSTRATPVTVPTAAQIADTVLGRNLAGGSDGGRTVRDALRASRNKSAISGSTLTVYQEDDATPAWTAAVSTAERDALQSIDPT